MALMCSGRKWGSVTAYWSLSITLLAAHTLPGAPVQYGKCHLAALSPVFFSLCCKKELLWHFYCFLFSHSVFLLFLSYRLSSFKLQTHIRLHLQAIKRENLLLFSKKCERILRFLFVYCYDVFHFFAPTLTGSLCFFGCQSGKGRV